MIDPNDFLQRLQYLGVNFYSGVPDSLLKDLCAVIHDNVEEHSNIIAANEGGAIAIASGYHLSTGEIPCVYLQNSGLGNIINPLTSLTDKDVYGLPCLIIIGWRGEPNVHDEPQHKVMGCISEELLNNVRVPFCILSKEPSVAFNQLENSIKDSVENNRPVALLVRKDTFSKYSVKNKPENISSMSREEAIQVIASCLPRSSNIFSTTGKISRELYETREQESRPDHSRDFYNVGAMGHVSQIALGALVGKPDSDIYCLDGDGALIMHMGALAITGQMKNLNLKHIVLNNSAHESVGGQPTVAGNLNLGSIAKACGYQEAFVATDLENLRECLLKVVNFNEGPVFLEVKVSIGSRNDLVRPKETPMENKLKFIEQLRKK